ncbi:MAG: TonB-dependent receptor, partial [Candidatus Thiodiazotropha sp.]
YDNQNDEYDIQSRDYDGTIWSSTETQREKRFKENSYRIGASYQIAQNSSLYSNVSTGFRTPLVDQLYAGDVRGGNYLNNEDIDVQRSINYELGFKGRESLLNTPMQYEVSLFRTDNKDIIGRRDGTYYSGDEMVFDNVGDARNQGLEIWLRSQTMENLTLTLAYTYLKSEVLKHNPVKISYTTLADETYDIVGNELPRTPRHTIDLYATYAITPAWSIIAETYARSGYYADETNMIEMSGYGIFNLQTRYEMNLAKSTLELYAKVNNVFDNQYYKTVFMTNDSNKDDVFDEEDATITVDPGREYYAGLIYRF